jgi:hypothetical protein
MLKNFLNKKLKDKILPNYVTNIIDLIAKYVLFDLWI